MATNLSPEDAEKLSNILDAIVAKFSNLGIQADKIEKAMGVMSDSASKLGKSTDQIVSAMNTYSKLSSDINTKEKEAVDLVANRKTLSKEYKEEQEKVRQINEEIRASMLIARDIEDDRLSMGRQLAEMDEKRARSAKDYATRVREEAAERAQRRIMENKDYASAFGTVATTDKVTGASAAYSNIYSSLTSVIPFGGLLGIMYYGKNKEFEYAAEAQKAIQVFGNMGKDAESVAGKVAGTIRAYSAEGMEYITGDLHTINTALAEVGVSAKEAFSDLGKGSQLGSSNSIENNIAMALEKLDKAMEQGAGWAAKYASSLKEGFGTSIYSATLSLKHMAMTLDGTNQQKAAFINQVMAASSALRMYKLDVMDVAHAQAALGRAWTTDPNDAARGRRMAAEGTAAMTQSMGSMDVGMSAVIGERLGSKLPGGAQSGLAAWYAMQGGSPDQKNSDQTKMFNLVATEIGTLARETTSSKEEQVYFLMQLMHVSKQGAEAFLKYSQMSEAEKTTEEGKGFLDEYNKSMQTEGQKIDFMTKTVKEMHNDLANIGSGMLGILINTMKLIGFGVQMLIAKFNGDDDAMKRIDIAANQSLNLWAKSGDRFMAGFESFFKHGGGAFKEIIAGGPEWNQLHGPSGKQAPYVPTQRDIDTEKSTSRRHIREQYGSSGMSDEDIEALADYDHKKQVVKHLQAAANAMQNSVDQNGKTVKKGE